MIDYKSKVTEKLIETLESRIKSIQNKINTSEIQKGDYTQKGFIALLKETLMEVNKSQKLDRELHSRIRKLLATLTQFGILSSAAAWPRRYFYEMAYYREWEEPKERGLFKTLDALYHNRGFTKGWVDPKVSLARRELEEKFKSFYSIQPSVGWSEEKEPVDINQAALDLGRLLIRLFFFEGLAAELLEAFQSYEKFVYLARRRYRDHFVHLIYDFLMGCRILEGLLEKIHYNWKCYTDEVITIDNLRIRLMRSWLIACLLHDVGYSAETLEDLRETLQNQFFIKVPGFDLSELKLEIADYLEEEIDDFLRLLAFICAEDEFSFHFKQLNGLKGNEVYPEKLIHGSISALFADQLKKMDHGVAGALFVLLTLKIDIHEFTLEISDYNDKDMREKREEYREKRKEVLEDLFVGALAIALHNIRQRTYEGLTIDFRSHPISFLLMLCDDLHEWDRKSDYERTSEAFKAIFGFNVFPQIKDPNTLFIDKNIVTPVDGKSYETHSFFFYISDRVKAVFGKQMNVANELSNLLPSFRNIIQKFREPEEIKCEIEISLNKMKDIDISKKILLKTLALNLTNDVITLIYVGGDPRKRGEEGDRILELWKTFHRLFFKNLSNGPAICILHGYQEESVEIFFTAEYDKALKSYVIEEKLRPQPYK